MSAESPLSLWLSVFYDSAVQQCFVRLELRKALAAAGDLKSVEARLILVKGQPKLSFTYHHKTRDIVKNHAAGESVELLRELLAEKFSFAKVYTLTEDVSVSRRDDDFVLTRTAASENVLPALSHNRTKEHLIAASDRPYLHALGLADAKGNVHKTSQDKFRQINKYVEILDGLIKQLPSRDVLRVVDMGAGKGYLTFALYDHVVNTLKLKAEIVGVEFRQNLVMLCNDIAAASRFDGLHFEQGTIAQHDCSGADVVIALHACDTATDDAINKAVRAGTALIVVAPCCHKQIRREIAKNESGNSPLEFLMKYGTYVERVSEMVTDGMRAQLMELAGYRSNLFEFIGDAHTPKNVMIVGRKIAPRSEVERTKILESLAETKRQFGIGMHQLERLLVQGPDKLL
jgi:Methyltransferase domain